MSGPIVIETSQASIYVRNATSSDDGGALLGSHEIEIVVGGDDSTTLPIWS